MRLETNQIVAINCLLCAGVWASEDSLVLVWTNIPYVGGFGPNPCSSFVQAQRSAVFGWGTRVNKASARFLRL